MGQGRDSHCHPGGWVSGQICRVRGAVGTEQEEGNTKEKGIAVDVCVGIPRDAPAGVEKAVWEKGWEQGASQPAAVFSISTGKTSCSAQSWDPGSFGKQV